MTDTATGAQIAAEILNAPAETWLQDEYIIFSKYAIRSRALMDQDGLKPVNRRIIYAMFAQNNTHLQPFVKAARVVGDVLGRYHPHGDSSIADALARMAQNFSVRIPLIDKSGSVGFVTGDTPAAPRYWESRLTKEALELVKEVREGAVPMTHNYDGTSQEPIVLPSRWPVDIINGTQGIAVGFASNMPSHNPTEVMEALASLLRNPKLTLDELIEIMPGPDLATGGEILEVEGIRQYYETGSGRFVIRGRYTTEQLTRGRTRITFHELPYGISAEQVITQVHTLQSQQEKTVRGKKEIVQPNQILLKGLSRIADLTDKRSGLKLVFETSQGANHLQVIAELFKTTSLQTPFSVNSTVLMDQFPARVGMLELLNSFVQFRKECTINRSEHRIGRIQHRLKQLDGLLKALVDIDKAISIIRGAADAETARTKLMKAFRLDEEQADYILSMQLRRLTKADSVALNEERKALQAEEKSLNKILTSDKALTAAVLKDVEDTKKVIESERRSVITGITSEELKDESKVLAQAAKDANKSVPCYVTRFVDGTLIRSAEPFAYTGKERKLAHSPIVEQFKVKTKDLIVLVGNDGIGRKVPASFLPDGKAVSAHNIGVDFPKNVRLVGVAKFEAMKSDVGLALATANGDVKVSRTDFPERAETFPVITLATGDEVVDGRWIGKTTTGTLFAMISKAGNVILFDASAVRATGHKAGGVKGMKLKGDDDCVISFSWVQSQKDASLVTVTKKTIKQTPLTEISTKGRGGMGVATQLFKPGEEGIVTAFAGTHATVCSDRATRNTIALPPLVKRNSRGVDFGMSVLAGSSEVFSM